VTGREITVIVLRNRSKLVTLTVKANEYDLAHTVYKKVYDRIKEQEEVLTKNDAQFDRIALKLSLVLFKIIARKNGTVRPSVALSNSDYMKPIAEILVHFVVYAEQYVFNLYSTTLAAGMISCANASFCPSVGKRDKLLSSTSSSVNQKKQKQHLFCVSKTHEDSLFMFDEEFRKLHEPELQAIESGSSQQPSRVPTLPVVQKFQIFLTIRLWPVDEQGNPTTTPVDVGNVIAHTKMTVYELKMQLIDRSMVPFTRPGEFFFVEEESPLSLRILHHDQALLGDSNLISGDILHVEKYMPGTIVQEPDGEIKFRSVAMDHFSSVPILLAIQETIISYQNRAQNYYSLDYVNDNYYASSPPMTRPNKPIHHYVDTRNQPVNLTRSDQAAVGSGSSRAFTGYFEITTDMSFGELLGDISNRWNLSIEQIQLSTTPARGAVIRAPHDVPVCDVLQGSLWILLNVSSH
jgi:hypothetical protein